MTVPTRLLFVCAGNICRSPMAEALFRHLAKSEPALAHVEARSAGTIALNGNLPNTDSVEALRKQCGVEMAAHRARALSRHIDADIVLPLDRETERETNRMNLQARVEMLGDFAGTGEEVPDPYMRPQRRHMEVAALLERLVGLTVARLATEFAPAEKS